MAKEGERENDARACAKAMQSINPGNQLDEALPEEEVLQQH